MSLSLSSDVSLASESPPARTRSKRAGASPFAIQPGESLEMRQLRHQTKNALQRILWELSRAGGDECSRAGVRHLANLERRVCLTAEIADALFGFSRSPGPIVDRLHLLGTGMVELLCTDGQDVTVDVLEHGTCPQGLCSTIVRVAHEMIGNALKHGLRDRAQGTVTIRLFVESDQVRLVVADDGSGFALAPRPGEGMSLSQALAEERGGDFVLRRVGHLTAAELTLPLRQLGILHRFQKEAVLF